MLNKAFKKEDGPFVKVLDSSIQTFRVHRQAYYSGTFVGNHVHRSLKADIQHNTSRLMNVIFTLQAHNITKLCQSVVDTTQNHCPTVLQDAIQVRDKFKKVFNLFSKCHNIYDKNYVTSEEIKSLGKAVPN